MKHIARYLWCKFSVQQFQFCEDLDRVLALRLRNVERHVFLEVVWVLLVSGQTVILGIYRLLVRDLSRSRKSRSAKATSADNRTSSSAS